MLRVICYGEILWDNFKDGRKAGGAPMNVALHLNKQGIDSNLISSIGNDAEGKDLLAFLEEQGLPVSLVQQHPSLPTGAVEVELDDTHQAKYIIKEPVAWDEIHYTEEAAMEIRDAGALIFGSLSSRRSGSRNTLQQFLSTARLKVFDMNLRPPHFDNLLILGLLQHTDILKVNENELEFLQHLLALPQDSDREKLKQIRKKFGIEVICVTMGDKGAQVLAGEKWYQHPGYQVEVADTVGAGDAFLATFIAHYLLGEPMPSTLNYACAAGALVASRAGANPPYNSAELKNIIFSSDHSL